MESVNNPLPGGGHIAPFLVLHADLRAERLRERVEECAQAGFDGVIIHPRPGLRTPYLSKAWFEAVDCCIQAARKAGLKVWLYDEYPYPSGAAGGRVIQYNPDFAEKHLLIQTYPLVGGGRVTRALGGAPVLQAFLVPEDERGLPQWSGAQTVTEHLGMRNTTWITRPWDSRYYYPPDYTRRYECPRGMEYLPEQVFEAELPEGSWRLITFTVVTGGDFLEPFGHYVDLSNREATEVFLKETHERYRRHFSKLFGSEILGVFTDEPKYRNVHPWSRCIAAAWKDYQRDPRALLALLPDYEPGELRRSYRQLTSRLFTENWVRPISAWCKRQNLRLIGHISPEEDWWMESRSVGSILRNLREFSVPGCDLIIPAVGDRAHPVLSLTPSLAVSAAAQTGASHALCEVFGANGYGLDLQTLKRVADWLMALGINFIVPHGGFYSIAGPRRFDAPPTFLPPSTLHPFLREWTAWLHDTMKTLGPLRPADVAIVRPMTYLQTLSENGKAEADRLFHEAVSLTQHLLEQGISFHWVEDSDLEDFPIEGGALRVGQAEYRQLIVWPELLSPAAARRLKKLSFLTPEQALTLVGPLECEEGDVRAALDAEGRWFCVNLSPEARQFRIDGVRVRLEGCESRWIDTSAEPAVERAGTRQSLGEDWDIRPVGKNAFRLKDWTCNGVPRPLGPAYHTLVAEADSLDTVFGPVPRTLSLRHPRDLVFETSVQWQGPPSSVALCLEDGAVEGAWQVWVNEVLLTDWRPSTGWLGGVRHDLTSLLREGCNTIRIGVTAGDARHGLWLEPVLRGDFVVGEADRLRAPSQPLRGGDWSKLGYPHFSGAMDFEKDFFWEPDPSAEAWLVFSSPPAGMVEVFVNEKPMGTLLWAPWRRRIQEALAPGLNRIRLRVTNTLQNFLVGEPLAAGPMAGAEIHMLPSTLEKGDAVSDGAPRETETFAS